MSIRSRIVGQFRQPHGPGGHIAGWIMANRSSNRRRNAWTVDLLNIQPGDRVLEIGSGPGLALEMCAKRANCGRVVGLDHSQTMLGQAHVRNARSIHEGGVELHLGGLDQLPALGGPFDKVLSANVAQFFPDKAEAYRTIIAVMAPGGMIATTYQPRHKNPQHSDAVRFAADVAQHMTSAGFTDIRTQELQLQPVPAVCVLGTRSR